MNRCRIERELSVYMDNQLSQSQKLKVDEHLKECESCRLELERLKTLSEKLKVWHLPDVGSGFAASVSNAIVRKELERGQVKMKKKTLAILIPSGALAGILLMVLSLSLFHGYAKRGVQGKLRASVDDIGEQFAPAKNKEKQVGSVGGGYQTHYRKGVELQYADKKAFDRIDNLKVSRSGSGIRSTAEEDNEYYSYNYTSPLSVTNGLVRTELSELAKRPAEAVTTQPIGYGEGTVIVIQPVIPATGEGEKIIRTAEIRLEVEDGKAAYKKASAICQELGGYLASSNFYKDDEGRESGTITMRIPKDKFLLALDELGALGKVENSNTNSQDVAQEYNNIKAQLDASMVVYNKMLEALQKRQVSIPEAMRLESELTPVLRRVEELKNKLGYLDNAVSYTTVTVNFHEPKVSEKVLEETRNYIKQSLLQAKIDAIKTAVHIAPVAVLIFGVSLLVVIIAVCIAYLFKRWFKRG
ncbi:MAG: DUF4349 domain-containing protein [Candidatus Omnitrophota bacterium]|nr:DUF4349 domain-containing protein [Candidatus Omnitrophota bacterium]